MKEIQLIEKEEYPIIDFSYDLARKLSSDFEGHYKMREQIKDCIEKRDVAGVLSFIHKEQQEQPWTNPCCKL